MNSNTSMAFGPEWKQVRLSDGECWDHPTLGSVRYYDRSMKWWTFNPPGQEPYGRLNEFDTPAAAMNSLRRGSVAEGEVCEHCLDYCGNGCIVHKHERWGWDRE